MSANISTDIAKDAALAAHAAAIHHLAGRVVGDVVEISRRLTDAKRLCGHGNFGTWLKREFRWSEDTAERYMRVADLDKIRTVRNLDLPLKGLYLLAAPSTPPEVRDKIIERAQGGEAVSVGDIKQTIETAKGRKQRKRKPTEADLEAWNAGEISRAEAARRGIAEATQSIAQNPATEERESSDSHSPLDLIAKYEAIDREHGRAKALAILAGVPMREALDATRETAARLIDTALNPNRPPSRDDIGPDIASEAARLRARNEQLEAEVRQRDIKIESEVEEAKEARPTHGQPADDDRPSEWEWKPKCLAHLPVATRLEMLVGLLQDGLTPIKELVEALRLPANASVKRQAQLDGLQGMVGVIFNWINVVKDEVEEIRRVLVAYEQRDTANIADPAPSDDGLDIPGFLDRTHEATRPITTTATAAHTSRSHDNASSEI
jgi:Protein of unknown function (DUF3102)